MSEHDLNVPVLGPEPPRVFGLDSPEKLKQWLLETEREYLVFSSIDLVDALPWPAGVEALQQLCTVYAQHRRAIEIGREREFDPHLKLHVERPVCKTETLTADEIQDAIRCLVRDRQRLRPQTEVQP